MNLYVAVFLFLLLKHFKNILRTQETDNFSVLAATNNLQSFILVFLYYHFRPPTHLTVMVIQKTFLKVSSFIYFYQIFNMLYYSDKNDAKHNELFNLLVVFIHGCFCFDYYENGRLACKLYN